MKRFHLKKIFPLLAASLSMCPLVHATAYSFTGQVSLFVTADLALQGSNSNWFSVVGGSSAGNCKTFSSLVVVRLKDDLHGQQMYATVLALKVSGAPVTVWVDDTFLDPNGYCYAQQLTP